MIKETQLNHVSLANLTVGRTTQTELIRAARAAGCATLPGGGMAVYQAVDAFEIFTGRTPDDERMFEHFQSLVAR